MTTPDVTYAPTARTTPSRYPERATYERAVAHALLDEAYVCDVAFVADGRPRALPTLFVRIDDTLYLHGSTAATPWLGARRGHGSADNNADADNDADGAGLPICVTVTVLDGLVLARSQFHHSANYRSLVAHGVARLVTDETAKRTAMTALVEKVGTGRSSQTRPPTAAELAKTAVLALPLAEVSVKRRTGGVGDDAEDLDLPYWAGVVPVTATFGYGEPDDGVRVPAPDYVRTRSPWFSPAVLRGEHVLLEPMRRADAGELRVALDDEELYRHMSYSRPGDDEAMLTLIDQALEQAANGELIPFTMRDARTGEVVGTTAYYAVAPEFESIAIGRTQVARSRWRSAINTEAKLLLMTRAFETLGAGRVEWHTDIRNDRSQAAIERLGATREGVLRRHRRRSDGSWRDTVTYAMTIDDWPVAKNRLVMRLGAGQTDGHVARHH